MQKIRYILNNSSEPDVRLADALLFRSLSNHLEDLIEPLDSMRNPDKDDILWGPNPMGIFRTNVRERQSFLNQDVRDAINAEICDQSEIQVAMDWASKSGMGVILRNMKDPMRRLRYTQPGDRYDQHSDAIGAKNKPVKVMVQENHDLGAYRRFFVVAGEIVTETPLTFKTRGLTSLSEWQSHRLQAKDQFSELEHFVPEFRSRQNVAALSVLEHYNMPSGYIDVGLTSLDLETAQAKVETVASTAPGGADMYLADPDAYAAAVAASLHIIEPSLDLSVPEETAEPYP
jgi:hypothetical protein